MANRIRVVDLSKEQRAELERRVRAKSLPARQVERARIVLLSSQGYAGRDIAELVGCSVATVSKWRQAFAEQGLTGLEDAPRSGRPREIGPEQRFAIWFVSQQAPPQRLGISHWSSRALAAEVGIDHSTIARLWNDWGLQPWRLTTFKVSADPDFEAKLRDVVGLYMNPPDKAIVLSVDEKGRTEARCRRFRAIRFLSPPSEPDVRSSPGRVSEAV